MYTEVHNAMQPAMARRTILASSVLMAGALVLAFALTWSRSEVRLGDRVRPDGWDVSFRPPARFVLDRTDMMRSPRSISYLRPSAGGPMAILTFHLVDSPAGMEPAVVCRAILIQRTTFAERIRGSQAGTEPVSALVGFMDGAELTNTAQTFLVRCAVQPSGRTYVITLEVARGPIDARRREMFDMVCRSVELHGE